MDGVDLLLSTEKHKTVTIFSQYLLIELVAGDSSLEHCTEFGPLDPK